MSDEYMVGLARSGHDQVRGVLLAQARGLLRKGEPLPEPLRGFVIEELKPKPPAPRRKVPPHPRIPWEVPLDEREGAYRAMGRYLRQIKREFAVREGKRGRPPIPKEIQDYESILLGLLILPFWREHGYEFKQRQSFEGACEQLSDWLDPEAKDGKDFRPGTGASTVERALRRLPLFAP